MLSLPVVIVVFLPPFYARYGNTLAQKQTTALKTHLKRRPHLHSEKKEGVLGWEKLRAGWKKSFQAETTREMRKTPWRLSIHIFPRPFVV